MKTQTAKRLKEKIKHDRIYKTYGLDRWTYEKILEAQGEVCGACGELPPSGRLCIDHIHAPGFKKMPPEEKRKYIRGIVCFLCNTSFRNFDKCKDGKKNRQRLEGVYRYFQQYKLKGE